jgi:hypothetical protein
VVDALEQIAYHHLPIDGQGDGLRAIDKVAEALDPWVDLPAPRPAREVPGTTIAPQNDLDLPASLLPESPGPTLDGAGLGL